MVPVVMQDSIRDELLAEQPKIDSSIKSFASYLASGMHTTATIGAFLTKDDGHHLPLKDLSEVLAVCRGFSKFINQHIVPIRSDDLDDCRKETIVVAWNYLVASSQKPTKHLGRSALRLVWNGIRAEFEPQAAATFSAGGEEKIKFFLDQYQRILRENDSDDARLIWAIDGGKRELGRRASDRKERANRNRKGLNMGDQDDTLQSIEEEDGDGEPEIADA